VIFVVDKAAMEQLFSEYFGFPCHLFHHYPSSGAVRIGQMVADGTSALSLIQKKKSVPHDSYSKEQLFP
jgi:aromatic ring-opening dioxygenase catalytic subunit (LigB family)